MPEDIHMARLLAARAYTVYVPLLFGKPGDGNSFLRDTVLRVFFRTPCWGPRFACASKSSLGTIAAWVAALSLHINSLQGGAGLAVMGNCLTGSLPLALMADASVRPALRCAVLSQPALPLGPWPFPKPLTLAAKTSLGVSESDLRKAALSGVPVLAFRFIDDPVVPQSGWMCWRPCSPKTPRNSSSARYIRIPPAITGRPGKLPRIIIPFSPWTLAKTKALMADAPGSGSIQFLTTISACVLLLRHSSHASHPP